MIDFMWQLVRSRQWWPIALGLLPSIAAFKVLEKPHIYDTLYESYLWLSWGLIWLLVGGVLLVFPRPATARRGRKRGRNSVERLMRRRVGSAVAVGGITLVGVSAWVSTLPRLPEDQVVITLLDFTPVSQEYALEADNYTDRLYTLLQEQTRGRAVTIKRLPVAVGFGGSEETRRDSAVALGTSRRGAAHFVLWGDIVLDSDSLTVRPRLTAARPLEEVPVEHVDLRTFVSWDPNHLIFKQWSSEAIASVTIVVLGWAYLQSGEPDQAIRLLTGLSTDESNLLLARAYRLRFGTADHPLQNPGLQDLRRAVTRYQAVSGPAPWRMDAAAVPSIAIAAGYERAFVLRQLASFPEAGSVHERLRYLESAISSLEAMTEVLERTNRRAERAAVLLQLAASLGFSAELNEEKADSLLERSSAMLELAAPTVLPSIHTGEWGYLQGMRASVKRFQAMRLPGGQGDSLLHAALVQAQQASQLLELQGNPSWLLWLNVALISEQLAHRTRGDARKKHVARALEYHARIVERTRRQGGTLFEVERDQRGLREARSRLSLLAP